MTYRLFSSLFSFDTCSSLLLLHHLSSRPIKGGNFFMMGGRRRKRLEKSGRGEWIHSPLLGRLSWSTACPSLLPPSPDTRGLQGTQENHSGRNVKVPRTGRLAGALGTLQRCRPLLALRPPAPAYLQSSVLFFTLHVSPQSLLPP